MKKIILVGCLLAGVQFSALAVKSYNVGGVLRVDSQSAETLVSVPWVGYGVDGTGKIDISRLVKTANLVQHDVVEVVRSNGVYEAWFLDEYRKWQPAVTIFQRGFKQEQYSAESPDTRKVERGIGLWVFRRGENRDLTKPFYLTGQYEASAAKTTIAGGSKKAPAWTLLVNPEGAETDLNAADWKGMPLADDLIAVAGPGGYPQFYTWKNDKWTTSRYVRDEATGLMRQVHVTDVKVAPGTGFWYVRKGAAFEFNW